MAKNARTHDISMIDYHVTDVETLAKVLNDAVTAACPKARSTRYRRVYVLLLCWTDDDLGVETELDKLEAVFQTVYHYTTDQWKIPSSSSHNALVFRIMQVIQGFASKDELFITYYGGHGYMNDDRQCVWLCNQQPGAATLQWSSIQTMLEEAESDVLILLDCCAAASSGGSAGKGVTEVIAACGFEAPAPGVGHHSFTSNLTDELKYLGRSKTSFTTAFLHNKVLARLKQSWNPRYINDEHRERRRTPIYIHLAEGARQRSIELGPHLAPPQVPPNPQSGPSEESSMPSTSSPNSEDVDMLGLGEVSQSSLSEDGRGSEFALPQVLISVALEDGQMLHYPDWMEWLSNFPAVAKSVRIQGMYRSNSTLVHLSLPVAVWDAIPSNPAISFISFIKTHNLAPSQGFIYDPSKTLSAGNQFPIALDSAGYHSWRTDPMRYADALQPMHLNRLQGTHLAPGLSPNFTDLHLYAFELQNMYPKPDSGTLDESGEQLKMLVRTLGHIEIQKTVLGEEHPRTIAIMDNSASTYWNLGRWKEAEELEVQPMESRRVLGQEHPGTLISMNNSASIYWNLGRWKEMGALEVQLMEKSERVLGEEHPSTLIMIYNPSMYWNPGPWKKAEALGLQLMKTRKRVLGEEHPGTLVSMENLALIRLNQGRFMEAEALEVHVMETRKRVLGEEHPDTRISMNNLAIILESRNRKKWAITTRQTGPRDKPFKYRLFI
ncbi:MAG: hypothetical protein Q9178_006641 [Gyalolechia marmorata]